MVSIKWCKKQKNGLEIIDPNNNMSESYLHMAEESLSVLAGIQKSNIWIATTSYYIMYYSLYAVMLRLGIKCEIHSCSLEFMKQFLQTKYNNVDIQNMMCAFDARINLQYYADRPVEETSIQKIAKHCKTFFLKTKNVLSKISEEDIMTIRKEFNSSNTQSK